MRIDVNLATKPYEDARLFWMRWGTGVALLAILSAALLAETVMGFVYARQDVRMSDQIKAEIAKRDQERARAEAFLNEPKNRDIRDRSQFLNALIERKAFSWTQVFTDLERIMPARLHVVSIHPELTEEEQLQIKLTVAGESRERALDLVRRMEESPRFRQPVINSENAQTNSQTPGDNVEFQISALYVAAAPEAGK
ncbi:MAG TPA: PilN domain-containing protein [Terriglobales bacterium]|nr:PilN domain-containing protein [Terriglobales bacterium]